MRIVILLLSTLLVACDDFTQVSNSGFGAFEPALAVLDRQIAVAWNDNRQGSDDIYLRLVNAGLQPLSDELRLTSNGAASYEADMAVFAGKLALTWYDRNAAGQLRVMLGMWDTQGRELWQHEVFVSERNGRVPLLETVGDRLFIAWIEEDMPAPQNALATAGTVQQAQAIPSLIHGAWLDATGAWIGAPFTIAPASRNTWNLNADALPDGRIALVFDAQLNTAASELYLSVIDGSTAQTNVLTADDGFDSKYPDIAVGTEGTALTWFDAKEGNNEVYLALIDVQSIVRTDNSQNFERSATRITTTQGDSIGAYLAWNGSTLGLAWNDNDPGQHEIYFQRFDRKGQPLAQAERLTDSAPDSLIPAIVPYDTGFILGWGEAILGNSHEAGGMNDTRSEIVLRYVK